MKFSVIRWICVSILITWCVSAAPIALISPPNTLDSSLSRGEQHHPPFQRQQYPFHVDDQLLIHIMTNIKTQIHTNILAKISGSICEKIRAKLSVEAKILGGIIKMDSTKVNAIQTAAINGLQDKIDSEILNELEVHVFQRMEDRFRAAYADKTLASESDLAKLLIDLETDVVSQVKVALPKIEAKLEVFVDTELKTHIKEIEVEIPLLMSIKIGVDIDVSVTVKASLQLAIQACARANVRILAKALLHGFR